MSQATASLVPNNLNEGNLPVVYLTNVAFGVLGCGVYYLVSARPRSRMEGKDVGEKCESGFETAADQQAGPVLLGSRFEGTDSGKFASERKPVQQPTPGAGPQGTASC